MVEVAEYLLVHGEGLKTKIESDARKMWNNFIHFKGDPVMEQAFMNDYTNYFNILLINEIHNEFKDLTFLELWAIVDTPFVENLLGMEFYYYE